MPCRNHHADEGYDGEGSASGTEALWVLGDHQNSTRDLVDSAGTVVTHITYDSFGTPTATTGQLLAADNANLASEIQLCAATEDTEVGHIK